MRSGTFTAASSEPSDSLRALESVHPRHVEPIPDVQARVATGVATGDVPQGRVRSMLPVFEPSSSGNPSAEVQSSTLQHRFKPCTQGSAEVPPVAIQVAPQGRKQSTTCGRQGGLCSPLFSPTAAGALSMHSTAWCLVAPPPATFDESAPPLTSRDNRRKKQHRRRAQAKRDAYRACYSKAASADIHRACMSDLDIPQSFSNLPRQLTCPPGASGGFPSDSDTNSPPVSYTTSDAADE